MSAVFSAAYSYISSPLHSSGNSSSSDEDELKYHNLDDDLNTSAQSFTSLAAPTSHMSLSTSSAAVPSVLSSIPTPVIISPTNHMGASAAQSHTSSSASYVNSAYGRSSHNEPTLLQAAQGHRMLVGSGALSRGVQQCVSPSPSSDSLGSSGHGSWTSSPGAMHDERVEGT